MTADAGDTSAIDCAMGVATSPLMELDGACRVVRWNDASRSLFGWTESEVVGAPPPITDREHWRELKAVVRDALAGHPVRDAPFDGRRKDGRRLELRISASRLPSEKGEAGDRTAIVAMRDLTPYRRLEELHGQFVDMVSHELRTPLSSIVGYAALLKRSELEWDPTLRRRCVEMVVRKGTQMSELVSDLVCAMHIQAGSLQMACSDVDARDVVSGSAGEVNPSGRNIRVMLPDAPVIVRWDPQLMSRAVHHLVANAVKFSPKGGTINVSVGSGIDSLRIDIRDEGPGIPLEIQPHVFGRFAQADMSSTRAAGGMGLGLYIADHVVQAHGGHLELTSAPGRGSTFSIEMPAA